MRYTTQYALFNIQQLQPNTTKNTLYHSPCMKSNMAQGTKLLLLLSLPDIARSPNTIFNCLLLTHHYCYPILPRTYLGFFDKGAEVKGLENLKVLQKTVININLRSFHNIQDSSQVKPEPQGTKGL